MVGKHRWWVLMVVAFCISTRLSAAAIAELTLQSTPGDYIGGGQSFDVVYTPQNSQIFETFVNRTIDGQPSEIDFILGTVTSGTDNTYALVSFGTDQLGVPLAPGSYPNAQREPFEAPGFAGLAVSFQNRDCNTSTGSFVVTEAVFGVDSNNSPTIQRFVASFVQYCEGFMPPLQGTFYFDASGRPQELPDLTVNKTHMGSFTQGQIGAYSLVINNVGVGSTSGLVTVVDVPPVGLAAAAIAGAGWTCSLDTLTCTRSDALAAGNAYPPIILTVNVASDASLILTNTATVSGGGEVTLVNDFGSDLTVIVPAAAQATPAPMLERWAMVLLCALLGIVVFLRIRST